ncbi:alpha-(1,3)-fucosyltransferase C-like [Teleopsis dalmanni]|uniref:alpha-(1,3)-fucosyltransferase C-like n=1 Tax=Teleopsis dalmanni TaxID=139649 RepID=UPI0018CED80E|nr:alpha-(1,3)-fucosyltransferase C-like [Teleopsis dalmanni]
MFDADIESNDESDNEKPLVRKNRKKQKVLKRRINNRKRRFLQCIGICGILVLLILGICVLVNIFNTNVEIPYFHSSAKRILLWKSYSWLPELIPTLSGEVFSCESTKCILEFSNETYIDPNKFDAVVIDALRAKDYRLISNRNSRSLFVGAFRNPPKNVALNYSANMFNGYFDVLMSYRLNSDIVWTHYEVRDLNNVHKAPTLHPNWNDAAPMHQDDIYSLKIFAENKFKLVTSFPTSNTDSEFQNLVNQLNTVITIDVCANCDLRQLTILYKFILISAEAICADYVPKIFYEALKHRIVPVIYGNVDFSRFAPPTNFIRADEFSNAEQLGNFLKYLDKTPDAYLRYLTFTYQYDIVLSPLPICNLCNLLENDNLMYYQRTNVSRLLGDDCVF